MANGAIDQDHNNSEISMRTTKERPKMLYSTKSQTQMGNEQISGLPIHPLDSIGDKHEVDNVLGIHCVNNR